MWLQSPYSVSTLSCSSQCGDALADLSQAWPPYPGPDSPELPELFAELQAVLQVLAQVTDVHHHLLGGQNS